MAVTEPVRSPTHFDPLYRPFGAALAGLLSQIPGGLRFKVDEVSGGIVLDNDHATCHNESMNERTCAACDNPAVYSVTPPEPFRGPYGAWFCCERHLPSRKGVDYATYRDAVRPL